MVDYSNVILQGDCIEEMKKLPDNSVDSIITDPPYELGFMGKSWDNTGIANNPTMWVECLRVLKPGAYLLSFGGTRTYHRMACAIEDAGFEIRDMISWIYGSGFPKSYNIAKGIEGLKVNGNCNTTEFKKLDGEKEVIKSGYTKMQFEQGLKPLNYNETNAGNSVVNPIYTSKEALQWNGWGTALKPAHEPICMARKPLAEKTVAENCLKYGTGGINIDESRVGLNGEKTPKGSGNADKSGTEQEWGFVGNGGNETSPLGRFPANIIHDNSEEVRGCFPESKSTQNETSDNRQNEGNSMFIDGVRNPENSYSDSGNASRFFKSIIYQAKASKSERNKGCEELEEIELRGGCGRAEQGYDDTDPEQQRLKDAAQAYGAVKAKKSNFHPTVKPIALMEYLIKMVTPKGGIVLDPFAGSGTTLLAAKKQGYKFIGMELTAEYIPIINARLNSIKPQEQQTL